MPHAPGEFGADDYKQVLSTLPEDLPIVIANRDWDTRGLPIEQQISESQTLFADFPHFGSDFIIKPMTTTKGELKSEIPLEDVIAHVAKLKAFDIIGVTEKELGKNLLQRLRNLAKLRVAMDRENVSAPIHVWGGLDPVMTPLYFFAGAEIFDGVSWLRYAYHNGIAVYRDCASILEHGIETSFDHVRAKAMLENLSVLRRLTTSLRSFVDADASVFSMFEWNQDAFARAYSVLSTQVPAVKERNYG